MHSRSPDVTLRLIPDGPQWHIMQVFVALDRRLSAVPVPRECGDGLPPSAKEIT